MTNGARILSLLAWGLSGCDSSIEETEVIAPSSAEEATTSPEPAIDRREVVSPENICVKFEERASTDEVWERWVTRMNDEVGDCSESVSMLEESLDESYPNRGRRFLGVYDRCIDEGESPSEYWQCVQEEMPRVLQRIEDGAEREAPTHAPRARKEGERPRPRGKKGRDRP